jgi:hypothetical protein
MTNIIKFYNCKSGRHTYINITTDDDTEKGLCLRCGAIYVEYLHLGARKRYETQAITQK